MKRIALMAVACITLVCVLCSCGLLGLSKFEFTENEDGYTLSGLGDSKDTEIVVPDTYNKKPVTAIGNSAMAYNILQAMLSGEEGVKLTSVTLPETITTIGREAFANNSELTTLNIPSSVTTIGVGAFYGCSSLTSLTIPEGVTEIAPNTFEDCAGLTSITLPSTITTIGESAFAGCSSLTSITIPEGVTEIADNTFEGCASLETVEISDKIVSIGSYAFANCNALKTMTIPETVETLGDYVFYEGNSALEVSVCYDTAAPEGWSELWYAGMSGKALNTSEVYYAAVVAPSEAKAEELKAKIQSCNDQYKALNDEIGELNVASRPYQESGNSTMLKHYRDQINACKEQQSNLLRARDEYQEQLDALKFTNQIN